MPILKRETKEIVLPKSKAKLTLMASLNYGLMMKIWEFKVIDNEALLKIASYTITAWDFTDEKGEKLEITSDNFKFLPAEDGAALVSEVQKYFGNSEEKKNLILK
jgi:hypothetical protein